MFSQYSSTTAVTIPLFIFTILVGGGGNCMVLIDYQRNKEIFKTPYHYLISNIALADFIISGVFTPIILLYRFNEPFHLISISPFCEVFLFSSMLGISMQYYLFPLLAYNRRDKVIASEGSPQLSFERARTLVSTFWKISVASASVFAGIAWNYNTNLDNNNDFQKLHRCLVINESIDAYTIYFLVYCLPLYGGAIIVSALVYKEIHSFIKVNILNPTAVKDLEMRRFRMSAFIMAIYTVSWTPFLFVQLFGVFYSYSEILFNVHAVATAIGVLSSAINPILYYCMDDYYNMMFKNFGKY